MKGCKILYIGNDLEFGVPLLIVLGSLFTIWANTLFIAGLSGAYYWFIPRGLYVSIVSTVLIILISTALALFYGVKRTNPKLVRSWYMVKIIECILMSVAFALHCSYYFRWRPLFEILYGLPLLPLGFYLIACAKKIYKNMSSPSSIYQEVIIEPPTVLKV